MISEILLDFILFAMSDISHNVPFLPFDRYTDDDESRGCEKRRNLKANMNAMYCNRRTRDRDRLSKWIEEIKFETDPQESKFLPHPKSELRCCIIQHLMLCFRLFDLYSTYRLFHRNFLDKKEERKH